MDSYHWEELYQNSSLSPPTTRNGVSWWCIQVIISNKMELKQFISKGLHIYKDRQRFIGKNIFPHFRYCLVVKDCQKKIQTPHWLRKTKHFGNGRLKSSDLFLMISIFSLTLLSIYKILTSQPLQNHLSNYSAFPLSK